MDWPAGADGNVFRSLQSRGFDFAKPRDIDFQIDFAAWPPPDEAIATLERDYTVQRYEPEGDGSGYLQITIFAMLTYDFVIAMQDNFSRQLSPFGGRCECWGVLS